MPVFTLWGKRLAENAVASGLLGKARQKSIVRASVPCDILGCFVQPASSTGASNEPF